MDDQISPTNQEAYTSTNQEELLDVFLHIIAGSFARLDEHSREELLQDIQVSLRSMQVCPDETRTQLEGLHLKLRRLTYQALGQYPPGVFDLDL